MGPQDLLPPRSGLPDGDRLTAGIHTAMAEGKDPPERAQNRSLAPAIGSASTLDRTHALNESADHREEDLDQRHSDQQPLHVPEDYARLDGTVRSFV